MRQASLAALGVLLLAPALPLAAPHDHAHAPYGPPAFAPFTPFTPFASPTRVQRPWRRLSDAIIRRIWAWPDTHTTSVLPGHSTRNAHAAPGDQLVARYGDDVVLRFRIRTADEASALAEAAGILFLDVWEFNDDWADIRIAKDVVGIKSSPCAGCSPPANH